MAKQFLPQLSRIDDPSKLPPNTEFIAQVEDKLNYPDRFTAFYKHMHHLSIVRYWTIKPINKPPRLSLRQIDLPLSFLPWFIAKFDFFVTPSTQGGMPAGKISTDEDMVDGEDLRIVRAMDAGNAQREGGYTVYNMNRREHGETLDIHQNLTFSDSLMFEGGLLDTIKDLAEKYKDGTL